MRSLLAAALVVLSASSVWLPAQAGAATYSAPTPEGWKALPPAPDRFRDLQFEVAGDKDATCYLTGSVGGGLEANLKRWYGQLGATPPEDLSKLPQAELLGRKGTLVEIEGTFANKAGSKLLGLITAQGQQCTTLKLVGSKQVVDAEKERFLQLAKSIRSGAAAATPATAPTTAAPATERKGKGPIKSYRAPDSWQEVPSNSSMRLLTFKIGKETELSVIVLAGNGGGTRANLDRWRGQLDQPALTDKEFAALPKIEVFGAKVPLLEARGKFRDGMTGRSFDDAAFLGVVVEQAEEAFFFKLTGPHAEASALKQEFVDFCASLKR